MIIERLRETLEDIQKERRKLDLVESQIRSMIATLTVEGKESASGPMDRLVTTTREITGGSTHSFAPNYPVVRSPGRDKIDDVATILRDMGSPQHITVIAEKMTALHGKAIKRTDIEPGMNRHIQKAQFPRIAKVRPSTFGLPEWKHNNPTLAHSA